MESEIGLEISESTDIDLLVCGSCKRSFQLANILGFMKHKKFDCEDPGSVIDPNNKVLLCQACRQKFNTPWSLLKHAQNVHFLRIYLEQNYHVPSVSVEEEPKSAASSVDDGNYSSPVIEYANQQPKTLQHCTLPNEAPTESTSLISKNISEHVAYMAPVDAASEEIVKSESESINKEVINTLAISSKEKPKVDDVTQSDQVCCDNQDCGISVMPGTHESLKRCCSAVVPKKRKRHMEIKHRMNLLSRMRRQKNRSSSPASIVIDVTPDSQGAEDREHSAMEQGSDQSVSRMMIHAEQHPSNKTNSVIIQPGSTFTIPLSFAMSNSSQTVTVVDSDSVHGSGSLMPSCLRLPSSFELTSLPQSLVPTETSNTVSQPATLMPASQTIEQPVSLKKESDADKAGTPNILQGILAQMFSEKTITVPRMMPSSVETAVPHPLVGLKQEAGLPDQCEETSNSQASVGHSLHSKKRRYPTSRPYKCDQCDDAFNQRIHLKKHQSKHTGIKPFKCDQCDYATVERSHLKVHIRVHTGEKPFKCTYCEYATAQRSTLKIHLKRHHSTTDHCLTCSRRDHTQCYPVIKQSLQVLPPSSNNNNFVPASPFISPPGGNSTDDKKPENTSLQTTVSNVDNEK